MKLAELGRKERLLEADEADAQIDKMVDLNPETGLAYLNRYKYDERFRFPPKESDLKKAMELAGEDAEVLLTAARKASVDQKYEDARKLIEKGRQLHPKNSRFAIALASLELAEKHPDRAEAVLRKAYETKPESAVAYYLASVLIDEGKLEGEGQAEGLMDVLRSRGLEEAMSCSWKAS